MIDGHFVTRGGVNEWVLDPVRPTAWPRIERVEVIEDAQVLAVLLRESDGTISAIRITVEQLAD